MNQMDSTTPIHEWVERLRPGDLIRVSYGSNTHYVGTFKYRKNTANGWILHYWDLPNSISGWKDQVIWYNKIHLKERIFHFHIRS